MAKEGETSLRNWYGFYFALLFVLVGVATTLIVVRHAFQESTTTDSSTTNLTFADFVDWAVENDFADLYETWEWKNGKLLLGPQTPYYCQTVHFSDPDGKGTELLLKSPDGGYIKFLAKYVEYDPPQTLVFAGPPWGLLQERGLQDHETEVILWLEILCQ